MIRVCVAGVTGWVGGPVADAVKAAGDLELVAGVAPSDATSFSSVAEALDAVSADEKHGERVWPARRCTRCRLPSFSLSTEVLFAADDERLSIRHDAGESAAPYIAGTLIAIRAVPGRVGLTRGLDQLLN